MTSKEFKIRLKNAATFVESLHALLHKYNAEICVDKEGEIRIEFGDHVWLLGPSKVNDSTYFVVQALPEGREGE